MYKKNNKKYYGLYVVLKVYGLQKKWVNKKISCNCKALAKVKKERYFKPEDWYCVRFNNKVYF